MSACKRHVWNTSRQVETEKSDLMLYMKALLLLLMIALLAIGTKWMLALFTGLLGRALR